MKTKLANKEKGFTIIEVLIVLAIAGLILLIVFLAVPALQRNSRNTQRANDAAQVGGIINECLANRNGVTASCDAPGELSGLDTGKLGILKTVTAGTGFPGNLETINFGYGAKCGDDGATVVTAGVPARSGVVLYNTESSSGGNVPRCVSI